MPRNFRKRKAESEESAKDNALEDEETRLALEEVKLLQKLRERKSGIPATNPVSQSSIVSSKIGDKAAADGDKEELVLQDTFAQETAVLVEDPNMLKFIEQELAKKRGKNHDATEQTENKMTDAEDELYKIPEHLKVTKKNSEESSTQWTTGIAEIQLPIEYKLKNIEETEAAKKNLQEKRLIERSKTESCSSWSHDPDYFQRGKDYSEKLRRDHPELFKDGSTEETGAGSKPNENGADPSGRRLAATDELMLDRFRKRERQRVMRR